jgi:hypothetical protein
MMLGTSKWTRTGGGVVDLEREEGLQPAGMWVAWYRATVYAAADIIAWAYPIIDLARPRWRLRW